MLVQLDYTNGAPSPMIWCNYLAHGAHRDVHEGFDEVLGKFVLKLELASSGGNQYESFILQEHPAPWDEFGENLPTCHFHGTFTHSTRRGEKQLSCLVVQHCGNALDKIIRKWPLNVKSYTYLEAVTFQATEIIAKVQARNGVACDMHFGNLAVTPGFEDWKVDPGVRPQPLQIRIVDAEGLHTDDANREVDLIQQDACTPLNSFFEFLMWHVTGAGAEA